MWYGRTLVSYLSYDQTSSRSVSSIIKGKWKENRNEFHRQYGMDLSYFDNDFLIGPSENFDYLIDDVNDNVK